MKITLLQSNPTVGDLQGNAQKIINAVKSVQSKEVDLFVTSELALLGYPAKDLLLNKSFIKNAWQKLKYIAKSLQRFPPCLIGTVVENSKSTGRPVFNSALFISQGKIVDKFYKTLLPSYDVFDENRYFEPATEIQVLKLNGLKIGVTICEDVWNDKDFWVKRRYENDPVEKLTSSQVDFIINISASPFSLGKQKLRQAMLSGIAKKYQIPLLYVNQVGGNDDLVFDGRSCVFDKKGKLIAKAKAFREDILLVDTNSAKNRIEEDDFRKEPEAFSALVLGTRDYLTKCGFKKVLLGLSGGIDSSLTAVIAVEAMGRKNVLGVLMPSPYTSKYSISDAAKLANNLGIKTLTLPISDIMIAFDKTLKEAFSGYKRDITEENIQARIRGNLLMALSNKYGAMLLTTGNKSELSVGYCTIYGDLSGGLAVISDVPKTLVYRLARWVNKKKDMVIPQETIDKDPSAELSPGQKDQDRLPPYDILDSILVRLIDKHMGKDDIVADGFDKKTVLDVINMIAGAEFKRKQAPLGIKITDRAFGSGWRMPIAGKTIF